MKKINLKSILKKTFKKKKKALPKKKSKPITKKTNKIKVKKKVGRPKLKTIDKKSLKEKAKVNLSKPKGAENLRLSKNQDQKPEIVKIKKQETEKKQFKPKDYIVYPKHGVGQILYRNTAHQFHQLFLHLPIRFVQHHVSDKLHNLLV